MRVHRTARFALCAAALFGLTGCDEIQDAYMKARFEGTTGIVSWCTQRNEAQARMLGLEARTLCADRHSKVIPRINISGQGSFFCLTNSNETRVFDGILINNSNHVITSLSVEITLKDSGRRLYSRVSSVWIPPGEGPFSVSFHDPIRCSEVRSANGQWPYDWNWSFLKGVTVLVR